MFVKYIKWPRINHVSFKLPRGSLDQVFNPENWFVRITKIALQQFCNLVFAASGES